MTEPTEFSRTIKYREFILVITRLPKQWQVTIAPPVLTAYMISDFEFLKGWQEEEVLERARIRVDDILNLRHPGR